MGPKSFYTNTETVDPITGFVEKISHKTSCPSFSETAVPLLNHIHIPFYIKGVSAGSFRLTFPDYGKILR